MEIWKTIKRLEGYEVSNLGRVRRIKTKKVLKQTGISQSIISLAANGKRPGNKAKKIVWKFKEELLNDNY